MKYNLVVAFGLALLAAEVISTPAPFLGFGEKKTQAQLDAEALKKQKDKELAALEKEAKRDAIGTFVTVHRYRGILIMPPRNKLK